MYAISAPIFGTKYLAGVQKIENGHTSQSTADFCWIAQHNLHSLASSAGFLPGGVL